MRHTVWRVDDPDACAAISAAVAEQPVVVADGHHRYETSLAYHDEREAADGDAGAAGATLAYVVELVEDELTVHAIHRLIAGLPDGTDLAAAAGAVVRGGRPAARGRADHRRDARTPAASRWCSPTGRCCSRPRPDALADARDLDSSRLDVGLAALPAARARASSTASTTCAARGRVGRRPGRRAAAPGHRRPDRGDRPRRRAHAPEDHLLPPQAEDRHGLPHASASRRRHDLPGGAAAEEGGEVAGALRADGVGELAVDLGAVLGPLDGAEHADRRRLVRARAPGGRA